MTVSPQKQKLKYVNAVCPGGHVEITLSPRGHEQRKNMLIKENILLLSTGKVLHSVHRTSEERRQRNFT